jgi:hypothetical protein
MKKSRYMEKITNTLLTLFFGIILTSCFSSMKVNVDIFDYQALIQSNDYKYTEAQKLSLALAQLQNANLEDIFKKIALTQFDKFIGNKPNSSLENNIKIKSEILKSVSEATKSFEKSIANAQMAIKLKPFDSYDSAYSIYYSSNKKIEDYFKVLTKELEVPSELINTYILQYTEKIDKYFSYGISVMDDPLASLVIRAPDIYWRKYGDNVSIINQTVDPINRKKYARANKTIARTIFGNSDIAIKMDAPGIFIVKGARVDSDEAIKTSFKVLNQGIKYLAFANGIPISGSNSGNGQKGNITIPELAQNSNLIHELSTTKNQSDIFTIAFMQTLVLELQKMEDGDTTSINNIKKSFEVYSNLLKTDKTK